MDVAESHVYALKQLINSKDLIYDDFNVGTGEGKSVLEIINCFEKTNKLDINFPSVKEELVMLSQFMLMYLKLINNLIGIQNIKLKML